MKVSACRSLTLLVAPAPSLAWAIDRDTCAVPYEEAQVLREQGVFTAAREQLEVCRAQCPAVLSADCTQWAAEPTALLPTVVFRVHDGSGKRFPAVS